MKQIVVLIVVCFPLIVSAQSDSTIIGIHFEHRLSWGQIVAKAEAENKYIFMDCYATWCGPCKEMDNSVYSSKKVGDYFNVHFVSVKVQMDSTGNDNDEVKAWYKTSQEINRKYHIVSLPTLLFFSPMGVIVNKGIGFMSADYFTSIGENALDTGKQYYTLLDSYKRGEKNYSSMAFLAREAKMAGDESNAKLISKDYINNYLRLLDNHMLYTKSNIDFILDFTYGSDDWGFGLLYLHANRIDSLYGSKDLSSGRIDYIIAKEEIDPALIHSSKDNGSPNWDSITSEISRKYNAELATRTVFNARGRWYHWKQDWTSYTKYLILSRKLYGSSWDANSLNNNAWDIFQHSNKKDELLKALSWSDEAIKQNPGYSSFMDTYANLLYKLGKVKDALSWEEKATALEPTNVAHKETLKRMEDGTATWPANGK